jgi:Nitrile hydratase beta subunit
MGGRPSSEPLNLEEHTLADWELVTDALTVALGARGIRTTDEHRRIMENLPSDEYLSLSYYERWAQGTEDLLVEKGILTREEIDRKMAELEATWDVS